ncbi:hypothetical protein PS6_009737 [Mucor atramentarius]
MSATLDISNNNYYSVTILLNGTLHFAPCNLLATTPFDASMQRTPYLQIKDFCITNREQDRILSIGDHGIEGCVFTENMMAKYFKQAQASKLSLTTA